MSVPDPATTNWIPLWDTGAGGASAAGMIPGEIKMWGGKVLPDPAYYGVWVWADGTAYSATTYPKAAANIAPEWKTAYGQIDPGAGLFRVPDLRGLTPVALDAMPGGARANRTTRAVAITVAARTGEETHVVTVAEMPSHGHGLSDPGHAHSISDPGHTHGPWPDGAVAIVMKHNPGDPAAPYNLGGSGGNLFHDEPAVAYAGTGIGIYNAGTGISIAANGSGGAHETMQPSVFVPYIVALDS